MAQGYMKAVSQHMFSYFTGTTKSLEIDGQIWKYIDVGCGQCILFLHGTRNNKSIWRGQMQGYDSDEFRRLSVDVPGICMTQYLEKKNHSFNELGRWLDKVIAKLEINQIHLVAHSLMTLFATFYASTRKDMVTTLTLLNIPDILTQDALAPGGLVSRFFEDTDFQTVEDVVRMFNAMYCNPPSLPKALHKYAFTLSKRYEEQFNAALNDYLKSLPLIMARTKIVTCPTLIINGDRDPYSSEKFMQSLHWHFPASCAVKLRHCGHMCMIERLSEVVAAHREFLNTRKVSEQHRWTIMNACI